jgi:flavodoxin
MKKFYFAIPIIAAFLVFTSVQAEKKFTGEKQGVSKMEKTSEVAAKSNSGNKKILVAYFSHSGNTREIANQIHQRVGGDIFEIQTVKTYPNDYDTVVSQARQELDSGYKPALKTKIANFKSYDLIFIGYPNWWGTIPRPIVTFLSEYDLSGKTIAPFCTHEGSRLGQSVKDIKIICPQSTVLDGLAVRGGSVKNAQSEVSAWLHLIGVVK